jgi:hypothetical protein
MASARRVSSQSRQARDAAATEAAARQLPLPLPADAQPHVALDAAGTPSLASARILPPLPTSAAAAAAVPSTDNGRTPVEVQLLQREPHRELHERDGAIQARPSRPSGPRDGRAGVHAHLDDVRSALAEGWEIVQPIFARPLWSVADNSATAFNFVLRRERATRLVTVPEGRGVQRFIRDHHLTVDYRS